MNERTELLRDELRRRGFTLPEDTARQAVSDHVDHVAMVMRIGRQAAKVYVTDDVIAGLAFRLTEGVRLTRGGTPLILIPDE